jgi:hypothetical protein
MSISNEDLLLAYDLSAEDLSEVLTDKIGFINEQRTVIRKGVPSNFVGTLAGHKLPAEVNLKDASLTSLTLVKRVRPDDGRTIYTVRGAMVGVKMDISIEDDNIKMDLVDKMVDITNASLGKNSGKVYTREEFLSSIANKNMRFAPVDASNEAEIAYRGMNLFFEHQGTSQEQFELAAAKFVELGAKPVSFDTNRVVSQYKAEGGIPVVGFEMLRQDRSKSRSNTGFLDLVDANMSTLMNYFRFAGVLRALNAQLNAAVENGSANEKQVRELKTKIENHTREMSNFTRGVGSWGGTHPGVTIQPDGSVTNTGEWYSTNIPCGRIQLGSSEDPIELDFWTNRSEAGTPAVIDLTGTSTEDPF